MLRWTALLPLIFFVALVFLFWRSLHIDPHLLPSTLIDKSVPTFSYPSLQNPEKRLDNKIFKGHISLLNVWASWCLTCTAENGTLLRIAKTGLVTLYGLNYKDERSSALQWLNTNGNPFQAIIYDPRGELAINLGVYGTPETFLIDENGIIRDKIVGAISPELWQNQLLREVMRLKTGAEGE